MNSQLVFTSNCEQTNRNIFVKAPLRGAFTKNLGLVSSQSAVGAKLIGI
jgi:hypothetical protein